MIIKNKKIVITRPVDQVQEFEEMIVAERAIPVPMSVSHVVSVKDWEFVDQEISKLEEYTLLLFTSQNAVDKFFSRLHLKGIKTLPKNLKTACIGPKTALALRKFNLEPDLVPVQAGSSSKLFETFQRNGLAESQNVLFPRAVEGREEIIKLFESAGSPVRWVGVYETVMNTAMKPQVKRMLAVENDVWVTFTSPSAVRFFIDLGGEKAVHEFFEKKNFIASIGPTTTAELKKHKLKPHAEPKEASLKKMIMAMKSV